VDAAGNPILGSVVSDDYSDNEEVLDIELFDGIAAPENLMFSSRNIAVTPRYASRKELNIGGRTGHYIF
jgi:hypothetical protein